MSERLFHIVEEMERDIVNFAKIIGQTIDIEFNGSETRVSTWIVAQLKILEQLHEIDGKIASTLNPGSGDVPIAHVSSWKILALTDIKFAENLILKTISGSLRRNVAYLKELEEVSEQQAQNLKASIKFTENELLLDVDMEVVEDIEDEFLKFLNGIKGKNTIEYPDCNEYNLSEWVEAQNKIVGMLEQARMPNKSLQTILDTSLTSIRNVIANIKDSELQLNGELYSNACDQLDIVKQSIEEYKKSD
jgi:hypothetical protein